MSNAKTSSDSFTVHFHSPHSTLFHPFCLSGLNFWPKSLMESREGVLGRGDRAVTHWGLQSCGLSSPQAIAQSREGSPSWLGSWGFRRKGTVQLPGRLNFMLLLLSGPFCRRAGKKDSLSLDSSAVFLSCFLDMLFAYISAVGKMREEGAVSGIFWFWVWYLINNQEQSLVRGVEKPRAQTPGHLIAGGSLVLAGERTCPVPSWQDVALCLLLPSFHDVTSCYTRDGGVQD